MRFLHFLAIAIAVFAINAEAQWYDPNTGKPVSDNEWRKKSGDFGAMLVVTGNVKKFLDEWYGTKETHIPRLDPVSKIKRGDAVGALLFFSGCANEGGACNATVDFHVLSPEGSVYGEHKGTRMWEGPAARKSLVLLSRGHLHVRIEPNDPYGTYIVIAKIYGLALSEALELKQQFEVVP